MLIFEIGCHLPDFRSWCRVRGHPGGGGAVRGVVLVRISLRIPVRWEAVFSIQITIIIRLYAFVPTPESSGVPLVYARTSTHFLLFFNHSHRSDPQDHFVRVQCKSTIPSPPPLPPLITYLSILPAASRAASKC